MGGTGIEIVARTVEVDGQEEDGIESVLLPVGLGLDEHHLLGEAVGGVRLFGIAVPEIVLLEGDRGELRVGADRPEGDELVDLPQISLVEELDPHHDVLVEEGAGILLVEADAAHLGGEVDDDVGPLFVVKTADVLRAG